MQNTIAQQQQRREKVTWNPQFHCVRKSNRNRRQSEDHRNRRAREPTFLCNGILLPEKTQCFVQIVTFQSHPWCNSSNATHQQWLAKHNQTRKTLLKNKYLARSLGLYSSRLHSTQPLSTLPPLPLRLHLLLLYLYSALLYSTLSALRYLCSTPTLLIASLLFALLYSALLFSTNSTQLNSTLVCSTLLYPTQLNSTLLCSTLLYSASTLPLLCLYSTLRRCPLDTMISGLVRMCFNDLLTQVPTGHYDLWASENVS